MNRINLLDLFSGIGGFHLGLEKSGFEVDSYFSEVDKYAISVYKNNFKNSTYVGSVTDVRGGELPRIDAITFGSPCQDFSLAGKRKGMGGNRSSLIAKAIRLISECRPRFFIWENVKGTFSSNNGEDFWAIIQAFANIGGYRLEWQLLNTSWFLPQNRERVYLVGYLGGGSGKSIFPIRTFDQKTDVLSRQQANTNTLTARYRADGNGSYIIERKQYAQEIQITDKRGNIKSDQENMPTIVASYHKMPSDSRYIEYREEKEVLVKSNTKKGYELTSVQKDNLVVSKTNIRRLTPIECERLQGFPDNWTKYGTEGEISDTQRYKMCGNAVTVDVVKSVANSILTNLYGEEI